MYLMNNFGYVSSLTLLLIYCTSCLPPPLKSMNFLSLQKIEDSPLLNDTEFVYACQEMAGVYKSHNMSRINQYSKVLIMAGVNSGFSDFMMNFKCHMDNIGLKFLLLAFDESTAQIMKDHKVESVYLIPQGKGSDGHSRGKVDGESANFFSRGFSVICCRKLEAVYAALKLGYDVIFSDVDIALLRDPLPFLFYDNVDHVHSSNSRCNGGWRYNHGTDGNSGFYSVRSNPRTIAVWEMGYRACLQERVYNDQTIIWCVMRTNPIIALEGLDSCPDPYTKSNSVETTKPDSLVSCVLDDCLFSAGNLGTAKESYFDNLVYTLRNRSQQAVMVHANYLVGREAKRSAMNRTGLWLLRADLEASKTLEPTQKRHKRWYCVKPSGPLV